MPDETPKRKEVTLQDIERELGRDKMAFFSDMVRPDQHEEREEDANLQSARTSNPHTPEEERAIIDRLGKYFGRQPTQQEINLALKQAAQF
jgi:hypothetical protein